MVQSLLLPKQQQNTDFLTDFCRSLLLCQLLLYQILILNQPIGELLPVVHHAFMLPAGEVRFQQKAVDFCDHKEEGKHTVRPHLVAHTTSILIGLCFFAL